MGQGMVTDDMAHGQRTREEPSCTSAARGHKWVDFHYWFNSAICTECMCLLINQERGYDRWLEYVPNTPPERD